MSNEPVTEAELEGAVLVLIIRESGLSTLWLDEDKVTVDEARLLLRATSSSVPGDPDPEGVRSDHD